MNKVFKRKPKLALDYTRSTNCLPSLGSATWSKRLNTVAAEIEATMCFDARYLDGEESSCKGRELKASL